jgi:hypothetical protein
VQQQRKRKEEREKGIVKVEGYDGSKRESIMYVSIKQELHRPVLSIRVRAVAVTACSVCPLIAKPRV